MARKVKFTFVVNIDVKRLCDPTSTKGGDSQIFVVRARGVSLADAIAWVGTEFDLPLVVAGFQGWPTAERGTEVESRGDILKLYSGDAINKRAEAGMESAMSDPKRNIYHPQNIHVKRRAMSAAWRKRKDKGGKNVLPPIAALVDAIGRSKGKGAAATRRAKRKAKR